MQNKSGTAGASTNFAVSNDLGTDSTYYGEFGMNSSVFSSGTPSDFFSLNNGIYFSGHDGDLSIGSGNGYKTYLAWGTVGQSAHVINASGALGLNTNITGTTNFGTSGQVLTSGGSAATPTWNTPTIAGFTSGESTATPNGTVYVDYLQASAASTNADVALVPKGTGAVLAQVPDNAATGGNKRGANAVDWQTSRASASSVSGGTYATIGGGYNNASTSQASTVGGGNSNNAGGNYAFIGGGLSNATGGGTPGYAVVAGGNSNSANGWFNFIGGGVSNSATSSSVITTAITTIAQTASTTLYLTATNANIKVGQLFQGTGVTNFTYATSTVTTGTAAVMNTSTISGTTLTVGSLASGTIIAGMVLTGTGVTAGTYIVSGSASTWTVSVSQTVASTTITGTAYTFTISQNATTAAGVTLSFYTPHGVVVGGGNNQATGSYSFIGGGGDAGTAANRNTASGDWSVVVGGRRNTASGIGSAVIGGGTDGTATNYGNTASGKGSLVIGGYSNQAQSDNSTVCGGYGNQVQQGYGFIGGGFSNLVNSFAGSIQGGYYGSTRGIYTYMAFPACFNPLNSTQGASQAGLLVVAKQTTDATATVLTCDGAAAGSVNQVILPNNSAYTFKATSISTVSGGGNTAGFKLEGVIKRGATAASTAIVGSVTSTTLAQDAAATTWTIVAAADTTNGALKFTFTGSAALATTAAASVSGTATITFAIQAAAPYVVGQLITVAGVTPTVFNGTWTVTACTTTTVQFALAGTNGPQTVAGTVFQTIRTVVKVDTTEVTY